MPQKKVESVTLRNSYHDCTNKIIFHGEKSSEIDKIDCGPGNKDNTYIDVQKQLKKGEEVIGFYGWNTDETFAIKGLGLIVWIPPKF